MKKPATKAEERAIERVRRICLGFPGATEKLAWGEPTFRAGKIFAQLDTHHHGAPHVAVWMPAEPGAQRALAEADPERYFVPPYVGGQGWVGARITGKPDWKALAALLEDAYRLVSAELPARRRPKAAAPPDKPPSPSVKAAPSRRARAKRPARKAK